jgi:hypothetical protein
LVAANQYERAKQVFEQLVDREPESEPAKRKLNDVLRRMGLLGADTTPPPVVETHAAVELAIPAAPKVRPDFEPSAPEVRANPVAPSVPAEPALDEETQRFIAQSLTDVDLFASYGLTQKAIGLLEAILRRAPRHTPTLEKLLDFVLGAGDDRRTAELAAKLEQISTERGDARGAERFGELRRRFQRAAGISDEELLGSGTRASASATEAEAEEVLPEITPEPSITEFATSEEAVEIEAAEKSAKSIFPTSGRPCSRTLVPFKPQRRRLNSKFPRNLPLRLSRFWKSSPFRKSRQLRHPPKAQSPQSSKFPPKRPRRIMRKKLSKKQLRPPKSRHHRR